MRRFVVTGTDTDVGKTVFSAALMLGLENAYYWKPLQSGVSDGVDTRTVQTLTGFPNERFFPEAYIFSEPLS
ncbi:MAG: AAA family ATPase, partial [Alphaproteobacteria bacterium]|nr:AAA family ATPase [Alphaproteobacteria bacterium]